MIDTTETKQATIDNLADLDFNEIVDMESIAQENLPHELEAKILNIVEIDELIQSAREKAEQAQQKAKSQAEPGWFKNRKAIESTQSAVTSLAEAQADISDSQVVLFENQRRMSEGMKFLLGLGVTNLTYNSMVIRTLYNKLKNTPPEEMSELAREELKRVVKQLLQQRTILQQQEQLDQKVSGLKKHDKAQDDRISENAEELSKQAQKDSEHDKKLQEISLLDQAQDKMIAEIKVELQRLFALLSEQEKTNSAQSTLLLDIQKSIQAQDTSFNKKIDLVSERVGQTEAQLKKIWWKIAVSVVAAASLILNVLQIAGVL